MFIPILFISGFWLCLFFFVWFLTIVIRKISKGRETNDILKSKIEEQKRGILISETQKKRGFYSRIQMEIMKNDSMESVFLILSTLLLEDFFIGFCSVFFYFSSYEDMRNSNPIKRVLLAPDHILNETLAYLGLIIVIILGVLVPFYIVFR